MVEQFDVVMSALRKADMQSPHYMDIISDVNARFKIIKNIHHRYFIINY